METEDFLRTAEEQFMEKICRAIVGTVCAIDGLKLSNMDEKSREILLRSILDKQNAHISVDYRLNFPIIGIGAPAEAWICKAARKLNAECVLSKYSPMASAAGAAVGEVREFVEACICRDPFFQNYVAFLPTGRQVFDALEEAKAETEQNLLDCAEKTMRQMGVQNGRIRLDKEERYMQNVQTGVPDFVRMELIAVIEGDL